jgi:hypothetical protein
MVLNIYEKTSKPALMLICFPLSASSALAQQINRFNPDTIRTIVIDSLVISARINVCARRILLMLYGRYQLLQGFSKYETLRLYCREPHFYLQ